MIDLKPCPFCGSKVFLTSHVTPIRMFYCTNTLCGAVVSFCNERCDMEMGDKNKIAAWNRRAKS